MNFLAHIYLSNNNEQLQIGNFIADFIKANQYTHLPNTIQKGIFLHRHIDTFTDAHPIVKQSRNRLDKRYGHYRGIIIDIFYDHFLAKNWHQYNDNSLSDYTTQFYKTLETHKEILPDRVKQLLAYLVKDNWLLNYANFEGIEKTLIGMNKRTHQKSQMQLAITDLKLHYRKFESDFTNFFENLCNFSAKKITELTK
ncbi:MAG: ACP phosphodiesterase [Flavobacteriaceae bacterium]|nr:ACP phosphodiesterase [Flavobacteriaceae bacterium]